MNKYAPIFPQLKQDYEEIYRFLKKSDYQIDPIPKYKPADNNSGEVIVSAYPIQGLLKYHGMADPQTRIAMFPSISLNNGAFQTITYLKFDPRMSRDKLVLDGIDKTSTNEFSRVQFQLDQIRNYGKIQSRALVVSRNMVTKDKSPIEAKGVGTSAAGGAAIARGAFNILYNDQKIAQNPRLLSIFSRFLSGSASRSSVGGISLWLSHPTSNSWDSFAIRLDRERDQDFVQDIALITIPLKSTITTTSAHKIAPTSSLYEQWCISRKSKILQFLKSFLTHDFNILGLLAELDSSMLHKIHTSSPEGQPYWNEKTQRVIQITKEMREIGMPVYFSIDTGPSVVLLTQKKSVNEIIHNLKEKLGENAPLITGTIQGASTLIRSNSKYYHLLDDDLAKFQT